MKLIPILALALLVTACETTGYQDPVTVVGNGTEPCVKPECVKHPVDKR